MNKEKKHWIKLIGMSFLFGSFLTLLYCFIVAYSNPSKTTLVDINSIGEANFKMFVLIPIVAFLGILAIILEYIDLKKEVERRGLSLIIKKLKGGKNVKKNNRNN